MTKVLLITGIYPPDIGGPATYIPLLRRYLEERRIECTIISLSNNVKESEDIYSNSIFISRKLFKPIRFIMTSRLIRKNMKKCDFIFANGLFEETAFAKTFFKKQVTAKIVGDPIWERYRNQTGKLIKIEEFNKIKLPFKLKIEKKLFEIAIKQFEKLTSPSKQLCERVDSIVGATRTIWIPNAVNEIEPLDTITKYDVITVSRLVSWKNIDKLIKSCAKLGYSLLIIGDGPEKENLEALSRILHANVEFTGKLNDSSIIEKLRISACFALLSDYEGMSFSLLQAMHCGKSILVSNARGNTDVIEDQVTGIVVDPNDSNKLLVGLAHCVSDGQGVKKLGNNALKKAKESYSLVPNLELMTDLITCK